MAAEVGESAKIKVASAAASRAQSLIYIVSDFRSAYANALSRTYFANYSMCGAK